MERILTIVIPTYNETEEELFPLLSSINNQIGVSKEVIEVILVNDAGKGIKEEFLKIFNNMNIKVMNLVKNFGPGQARQAGLNMAKSKYIMFCDADDTLYSVDTLKTLLNEVLKHEPDILTSPWIEETYDRENKCMVYIPHSNEATWMHGKIFKVSFLKGYNICFHETLRVHEDSYFLGLVMALTNNSRAMTNMYSYVWKWREKSITRENDALYTYESIPTFIEATVESMKELERRAQYDKLPAKVAQFAMYIYFSINYDNWNKRKEYKEKAEESFIKRIKPFMPYMEKMNAIDLKRIYNEEYNRTGIYSNITETFSQWLNRLDETYGGESNETNER